mgnify:CR=1 FL=1
MATWDPQKVSEECPIYVLCQPIDKGFGDKMVWYIYCMNVAKIFEGTLLVEPEMWQSISKDWEGQPHKDSQEYYNIAKDIFRINFQPSMGRFLDSLMKEKDFSKEVWKFHEISRGCFPSSCWDSRHSQLSIYAVFDEEFEFQIKNEEIRRTKAKNY